MKTSLAPGSRVVTDYLDRAGLTPYLDKLGFSLVGYGCTTCIGNSGPLLDEVATAVDDDDLAVVAVLSGNRNFEGRIHPQVRASYLASPPLCVAYALAGQRRHRPRRPTRSGTAPDGSRCTSATSGRAPRRCASAIAAPITRRAVRARVRPDLGRRRALARAADARPARCTRGIPASTYVQEPPFFEDLAAEPRRLGDVEGARVLVKVGDSITTDHISPAGSIKPDSPAGQLPASSTASSRATSTPTARAAATTR